MIWSKLTLSGLVGPGGGAGGGQHFSLDFWQALQQKMNKEPVT